MRIRPFLLSLPWVALLVVIPEFLFNAYSTHLPLGDNAAFALFSLSIALVLVGPAAGLGLAIIGLVKRSRPMIVHGIAAVVLGLAVLLYANSIPPKRYFAVEASSAGQVDSESR